MIEEQIFLRTQDGQEATRVRPPGKNIFFIITRIIFILALAVGAWKAYDIYWLRHRYLITAYCDCPICINIPEFQDGKFASRRPVYWGGVAADKSVPFGANVELIPFTLPDWWAIRNFLGDRRNFIVEDRGGKIRSRHLDIFFPHSMGGHEKALHWGARRMRVKINGRLMD